MTFFVCEIASRVCETVSRVCEIASEPDAMTSFYNETNCNTTEIQFNAIETVCL